VARAVQADQLIKLLLDERPELLRLGVLITSIRHTNCEERPAILLSVRNRKNRSRSMEVYRESVR
jgi:hypothetical protein